MSSRRRSSRSSDEAVADHTSDALLVRRLAACEVGAFEQIYERHSPRVYALCLRMMRSRERAEEPLQDTFWQLWRRPERYDPERGSLIGFLCQIARSRCLDRLRRERQTRGRLAAASASLELSGVTPSDPTPLQSASIAEERARVLRALEEIAPECREVIVLAYFEGLSQSQIASRLATPLGTVKTRSRRALLQLRRLLDGEDES